MVKKKLIYKDSEVSYLVFGSGPECVICLHGYGENGGSFAFLEKYAGRDFTFCSIDLPFHGDTLWNQGLSFGSKELSDIISSIATTITGKSGEEKMVLMGFSLGGRMALQYFETEPAKISRMILMAPDGMKINFWYWLATQTYVGSRLFRLTMKYPSWFFWFLKFVNRLGFVNASVFKFVNYYIRDEKMREQLFLRWTGLGKIRPRIKRIKDLIRAHRVPVRLIYGKHDRIILSSRAEKFRKGIEEYCSLDIIPSGHQVLHEMHHVQIVRHLVS